MEKQVIHRIKFQRSEIFIYAAIGLGSLGLVCSSYAQAVQTRSAIEAVQVIAAMRDGSLPTDDLQVKLAAPVTSSVPMARLEVMSVAPVNAHEVRMRLACADHSECLPFFATAIYAGVVDTDKFRFGRVAQSSASQNALQPLTAKSAATISKPVNAGKDMTQLRAGAPASLEFEADKIHVRIEVISLQSGVPGDRIRVSSLDHKQIYVAQVVTPTLLKGELQQ